MDDSIDLPPGFRFHPTDEEIIIHYLYPKMGDTNFSPIAIGEVDFNKVEPWDLPSKANMGEKEWFFFFQKDRKYPTGTRTNRATKSGYWKATGKDKEIYNGKGSLVGMKKTLVFYKGRAPRGERTNWVMHEFRVEGMSSLRSSAPKASKDEWVVSKVFHKSTTSATKIKEAKVSSMIPSSHGQVDSSQLAQPSPSTMESSHLIMNTNNNSHATTTSQPYFSTMSLIVDQLQDPQLFLNSNFSQHLISNEHASFRSKVDGFLSTD